MVLLLKFLILRLQLLEVILNVGFLMFHQVYFILSELHITQHHIEIPLDID
jgi:hypothetical protein